MRRTGLVALLLALSCGGAKPQAAPPPGDTHEETPPPPATTEPAPASAPASAPTSPPGATEVTPPATEPATPMFMLKNADEARDLMFAIDKGWGTTIFAYTGKPPKAKAALLFPTHCTAACDAPEEERCPVCKVEDDPRKRQQQEKEEEKRELAGPGGVVKVPWDGKVLVYEKVKGKKRCQCYRRVDPAPDTYTIKACGLRPSKQANQPTRPTCAETEVQLPLATPQAITVTFDK